MIIEQRMVMSQEQNGRRGVALVLCFDVLTRGNKEQEKKVIHLKLRFQIRKAN